MKLYVVGIGPGSIEQMTMQAQEALQACEVIAGYKVYVDLVKEHFPDKQIITTGMTKEVERCQAALQTASEGKSVAMVCSGDAGIYGMASLLLELLPDYKDVCVEVVPGITAASSGAALLGAPLGHDFAVISLSDLLTPWEQIEKRLTCAAKSDMVICLYNPSSRKRSDYLKRACELILAYQKEDTIAGITQNIGREGESWQLMTLGELKDTQTDMFTTVFVGNSRTKNIMERMVTPRGYQHG